MENFEVSFNGHEAIFNVFSKAVIPDNVAEEVLNHDKIGERLYKEFIEERFNGEKFIWSPLKKKKLKAR